MSEPVKVFVFQQYKDSTTYALMTSYLKSTTSSYNKYEAIVDCLVQAGIIEVIDVAELPTNIQKAIKKETEL